MASSNIVTLSADTFSAEVLQASLPVLVDFWAEWCGPCKMLAPVLDELADDYAGKLRVAKLNIDEHPALATQYGIRSIPTLLLFKNGEVVSQVVGLRSKKELQSVLERAGIS